MVDFLNMNRVNILDLPTGRKSSSSRSFEIKKFQQNKTTAGLEKYTHPVRYFPQ